MQSTQTFPSPSTIQSVKDKRRPWLAALAVIAGTVGCSALYVSSQATPVAYQLQFNVTSDVSFEQTTPRTAHLIILNRNGDVQMLQDNRFAAAFIDRRSNFRFNIPSQSPGRIFLSPAPPGQLVQITGVRAILREREFIQIPLDQLVPHQQVEIVARTPDSLSVRTLPGTQPPTLELKIGTELDLPSGKVSSRIFSVLGILGVTALLLLLCLRVRIFVNLSAMISPSQAAHFGAAAALILTMAIISKFNAHPDEYLHFEAAKYFTTHWLPPALDNPAVEPSFGHYGLSYLQDLDTAYFLIGKMMAAVPSFLASPEVAARLCNVLLFIMLAAWLLWRLPRSFAPALLLISPQVWYVFSYVNSDAWALTLCFVIMIQLANKDSLLSQYLRTDGYRPACRGGLWFATLLALLIMAKRNYYLFLPFIGLVAFWRTFLWEAEAPRLRVAKKWAVIAIAAAALYFPIRIGHEAINRFDISRLRVEQAEKFAAPRFKPSEIAAGTGVQRMALRSRGVNYSDLFVEYNWAAQTFQSFSGVYQWMSLRGPSEYYLVIWTLYAGLFAFLLASISRLSLRDALFAVAVLGLAVFMVLVSAYRSWTVDFQPQGRYLFPILPVIAFLFHRYRESLRSRVFSLLFGGLFACSIYSFVFVALKNIPK